MGEIILYALATGAALGLVYGLFRVLRLTFSHDLTFDILFCVLSAFAVFSYLLVFNEGRLRFFYLLLISLGFLLYALTIGKILGAIEEKIAKKIKKRLKKYCNSLIKYIIILKKFRPKPFKKKLSDGDVENEKGK